MRELPVHLLESLQKIKGFEREAFIYVHKNAEQITSIRINPKKIANLDDVFQNYSKIQWTEFGYYLNERPSFTFDPIFHAGCYYVQEASSMFLEQALKQHLDLCAPLKILDLCASPGGKSTHIHSLLSPESLLVSNEVIKTRAGVLKQNIIKWGAHNVIVTNNDPQHFSRLKGFFDVMIVDAPCSGSGLFRKDNEAIGEWNEDNVLLCCRRQKRIIADAIRSLKEGGLLIYSTCSYSKEEDEDIADWIVEELKMKNEKLEIKTEWNIVETTSDKMQCYSYRFFPHKVKGEGFYLSCFRKTESENITKLKAAQVEKTNEGEKKIIQKWIIDKDFEFIKAGIVYALPKNSLNDFAILKNYLNIQYAGVAIGEVMKDKLVPEHAFALSSLSNDAIQKLNLAKPDAVKYLQRNEINIDIRERGWQIVQYKGHNLGWINALSNRINNYYPKEYRILKAVE